MQVQSEKEENNAGYKIYVLNFILHNARIYRTVLVKRIWLALCSQVTRKF